MMEIFGAVLQDGQKQQPYAESEPLDIQQLSLSGPGPTEVLVRMEAAGVCHSDLSVVNGDRKRPLPMLLGHEGAGVVVAAGAKSSADLIGKRVVMTFLPRCQTCANCAEGGRLPCKRGSEANESGALLSGSRRLSRDGENINHHLGVSGFATYAVVDVASIVPVDNDVPADVAAVLGCAVLTGGGALINGAAPEGRHSVMIIGLGGVGMAALLVALARGAKRIIAVDMSQEKLDLAVSLGADEAYTATELAEQSIKADRVIECVGNPRAFESAFNATAVGGITVTVGLPAPDAMASISPLKVTAEARSIVGSYLGSSVPQVDIPRYEQWWREGRLPVEKLITHHIRLEDINHAMDDLNDGKAIRQIIMFDE